MKSQTKKQLMKKKLTLILAVTALLVVGANVAQATFYSYTYNSGFSTTTVPDGNLTGWVDSRTVSGIPNIGGGATTPQIVDVNVRLNLSGGYNGDLYGYLRLQDENNATVLTVLLNRVGTGSGGEPQFSFGYSTAGMNVTLDDEATPLIHGTASPGSGVSYKPDSGAGSLADFDGKSANGTWTFFLADLSWGEVTTVTNWGLDIEVVPEPVTWALIGFCLVVGSVQAMRWQQRRQLGKS